MDDLLPLLAATSGRYCGAGDFAKRPLNARQLLFEKKFVVLQRVKASEGNLLHDLPCFSFFSMA
jgi:hypothetical protein